jgi:hypothetical protein
MATTRFFHTVSLLTDGKVLITGGAGNDGTLATAEVFDPSSQTFTATGSTATERHFDAVTLLNGGKVLVTGGFGANSPPLATVELFDPVSGTFTPSGNMATARARHTATLRNDGTVLVAGGVNLVVVPPGCRTRCKQELLPTSSAELFDPISGSFAATGDMTAARETHTATLLSNGVVLVTGGRDVSGNVLSTAELFQ